MVFVDELLVWHNAWGPFKKGSCHMSSDVGPEELHAFAKRIGMKRSWYQGGRHPHYDLTPSKRVLAVKMGAVEVPGRVFVRCNFEARRRDHERWLSVFMPEARYP